MDENQNDKNKFIIEAINDSIDFEELMEKTDFNSWIKEGNNNDNSEELKRNGQEITPFIKFIENINNLESKCIRLIKNGENKSSFEGNLISNLFKSKKKRLNAKIYFHKEKEKRMDEYRKALSYLLSSLNVLQKLEENKYDKRLLILLYNDLSICYAGLENSSMSRGYAEEVRWIIEKKEDSYKKFCQKLDDGKPIKNDDFVSLGYYALYTVAVYNQAVAEQRSHYYSDAEKNFRRIIDYAEKVENGDTPLLNFNYYSALLNLSDLLIDLGRGKEAIKLLDKVLKNKNILDEKDIRYWDVTLAKINALIDQTEYSDAKDLLYKNIIDESIIKRGNENPLSKKHNVTSTGFKGFNYFVRCRIENAKNDLTKVNEKNVVELKQAAEIIKYKIMELFKTRHQERFKIKAYKQLSDIYIILSKNENDEKKIGEYNKDVINYLVKFISEKDEIDDLDAFKSNEDMGE